jgi:hypothetical protein
VNSYRQGVYRSPVRIGSIWDFLVYLIILAQRSAKMANLANWARIGSAGVVVLLAGRLCADEFPTAERTRQAIERGLMFVQADAATWRAERTCATCHHGVLTVLTLAEARHRGLSVENDRFADVVNWTKERLSKIDEPRDTRPGWSMVNTPAVYLGLLTQFVPGQAVVSEQELVSIRGHLLRHQEENGSWAWSSAPAKNRPPPFFESDEVATLLALLTFPSEGDIAIEELRASRRKAIDWLAKADETDTTQAAALRLLWRKRAEPAADVQPCIERFLNRQRSDGGFAQLADRCSDAYATGQSLYVLNLLGVPMDRPEIQRAIGFLVATQRDDGSWPMIRRGHEGVVPSENVVPIIYFGSAWATLGLMRSTPL